MTTTDDDVVAYLRKYLAKVLEVPAGPLACERLLGTKELAEFLGIPPQTLRQWRYLGVGPKAFKVGRHLRWDPAEVHRWLVEECSGPDGEAA